METPHLLPSAGSEGTPESSGSETVRTVPHPAEGFGKVPNTTEPFGKVPQRAERTENHTLTVREVARMFEVAGVARTERSIINWCQPNRQGISRLDGYFDPNERKYFITRQSTEAVIQEEIQRSRTTLSQEGSEPCRTPVAHVKHSVPRPADESARVEELERQILDLTIANRGKDYLIGQLREERNGFFGKLLAANRKLGELAAKSTVVQRGKAELSDLP